MLSLGRSFCTLYGEWSDQPQLLHLNEWLLMTDSSNRLVALQSRH